MKRTGNELNLDEYNNKLQNYTAKLARSDNAPETEYLENNGFHSIDYFHHEGKDFERSCTVYEKEGEIIVMDESYIEREGGMYMTNSYASEEKAKSWDKDLINQSINMPTIYLIESILFKKGLKAPENVLSFSDYTDTYSCHHYKWILEDKILIIKAIENFLNMKTESLFGRDKVIYETIKKFGYLE